MKLIEELDKQVKLLYPTFTRFSNGERLVKVGYILATVLRVREKTGKNDGPYVSEILAHTKLDAGYPWCAASIEFICDYAQIDLGPSDRESAAVANWLAWAKANGRHRTQFRRGYLTLAQGKISHIGIGAGVTETGRIRSYEGNTSPGDAGSQSDGQGYYRRFRNPDFWTAGFINMELDPDA